MRLLIQRVLEAEVKVEEDIVGKIEEGLLVFFAAHKNDTKDKIESLVDKLIHIRIFSDKDDKMNLHLRETQGQVLIVSQFTLYGNCQKGRRPHFLDSAPPAYAKELYLDFIKEVKKTIPIVQSGTFGASMQVSLNNDGPVTFLLEK